MILRLWVAISDDLHSTKVVTAIRHRLTTGIVGRVRGWWLARSTPTADDRDLLAILTAIRDRLEAENAAAAASSAETAAVDPK